MKAACDELGVTLIAYCPLAQGEIPILFCFKFSVYDWFFVVCLTLPFKYMNSKNSLSSEFFTEIVFLPILSMLVHAA